MQGVAVRKAKTHIYLSKKIQFPRLYEDDIWYQGNQPISRAELDTLCNERRSFTRVPRPKQCFRGEKGLVLGLMEEEDCQETSFGKASLKEALLSILYFSGSFVVVR